MCTSGLTQKNVKSVKATPVYTSAPPSALSGLKTTSRFLMKDVWSAAAAESFATQRRWIGHCQEADSGYVTSTDEPVPLGSIAVWMNPLILILETVEFMIYINKFFNMSKKNC